MRVTALVVVVLLAACQGEPSTVLERAAKHTIADRGNAMAALSAGLDEAFAWLKDHPNDTSGALAAAKPQIGRFYANDETDAFELYIEGGELLLYIPTTERRPGVWLGRTENHLVTEPAGLTPTMRKKIGVE